MSKQIRRRLEIIEDRFGKMTLRDYIRVEGGPDTPLHKAAHSGQLSKLKMLMEEEELFEKLNAKNYLGCTPLRLAATEGHADCVQYLIDQGADVNVSDIKAQTSLFVAVKNKHLNCVKVLLKAEGNPNGDLPCLCTPLYTAAQDGNLPIMQELVQYGADLDRSQINLGYFISSPLYITIAYHHLDCFKALLRNGADPDAAVRSKQQSDKSLYHATIKHNSEVEYVDLLYEFGASLDDMGHLAWEGDTQNMCTKRIRSLLVTPRSLQSTIRLLVRRHIGKHSLSRLPDLPLPRKLIQYLQHL